MIRIFAGYDEREKEGYHVFCQSILDTCKQPVSIAPLNLSMLGSYNDRSNKGTNAFGLSRFLVPYLCDYQGFALFMDGADMLVRSDLSSLWHQADAEKAVQVVKHDYRTKHRRKYIGTSLEADNPDYPRKNWSSVMLINCEHRDWSGITPEFLQNDYRTINSYMQRLMHLGPYSIGSLDARWNHLVGEQKFDEQAKIAHFTLGIPAFEHYKDCDYSDEWHATARRVKGV